MQKTHQKNFACEECCHCCWEPNNAYLPLLLCPSLGSRMAERPSTAPDGSSRRAVTAPEPARPSASHEATRRPTTSSSTSRAAAGKGSHADARKQMDALLASCVTKRKGTERPLKPFVSGRKGNLLAKFEVPLRIDEVPAVLAHAPPGPTAPGPTAPASQRLTRLASVRRLSCR